MEKLVLGGGCFWCTEAVFQRLKGVDKVVSGYMGGIFPNPSYREICTGKTGHAEVIQIQFDPELIRLEELLLVFFKTHDPTTLNRQGNDVGTQYRSVIFYRNETQHETAAKLIQQLEDEHIFDAPIVTELSPESAFYPAEDYHQDYFNQNSYQPYCSFVIQPKLEKFTKEFSGLLNLE
ncbi:MAG: peptide-methionine (S)-S-oxide reductase [Bacteroidota bacterium]|jgi:peptide-methionine (S)-S-oxide reductase